MNTKKLTTGVASAALLFSSFAPMAFADTSLTISGNGSGSSNSISADFTNRTVISQTNETDISNDVSVSNNTGNNSASGNTGSDVRLSTGDATSHVDITNVAGSNVAHVGDVCGCQGDLEASIHGNGSWSESSIDVSKDNLFVLDQHNDTDLDNNVDVYNNTGDNDADDNTGGYDYSQNNHGDYDTYDHGKYYDKYGKFDLKSYLHDKYGDFFDRMYTNYHDGGEVSLQTGDAESHVGIHNMAGSNVFH